MYTHIDVLQELARQRHQHLFELAQPRSIHPLELAARRSIGSLLIRIATWIDAPPPLVADRSLTPG